MIGQRTAVIVQPCFLPWRGYFDLLSRADVVILFDSVQYVDRSWFNRNRIMTRQGPKWVTVPLVRTSRDQPIRDKAIDDATPWRARLLETLRHAYGRCQHFEPAFSSLRPVLMSETAHLRDLAAATIGWGFERLGRRFECRFASDFAIGESRPIERLVALCKAVGADRYLSGPTARNYIHDDRAFAEAGIRLDWMAYDYPKYPQLLPYDESPLSIVDLIFNTGDNAARYVWPDVADRG
jgi:hypothetical protein